jgi:biopolymer transport protein TolQ
MNPFVATAYAAPSQFRGNVGAMIIDSDPLVKLVLLILFIFSVISWAIIIFKWRELSAAKTNNQILLDILDKGASLEEISRKMNIFEPSPAKTILSDGTKELNRIIDKDPNISVSILSNVETKVISSKIQQDAKLSVGLGFLASISNASPFIGLLGTVWGIMDSFREIGLAGSANLATVAPGISEALIATAAGLFVAIPAVLFYNYFNGIMGYIENQMETFQVDFMNLIRRETIHGDK